MFGIDSEKWRKSTEDFWRKNKNAKALNNIQSFYCAWLVLTIFCIEIMFRFSNHAHIRDQQVKIYKKRCFVFKFTSFKFLTGFFIAVFTGSWWSRQPKINKKSWKPLDFSKSTLKEYLMKIGTVSVQFMVSAKFWPLFFNRNNGQIKKPCKYSWSAGQKL